MFRRALSGAEFSDCRNPLDSIDDGELYEAFRFHHGELITLTDEIAADLEYVSNLSGILNGFEYNAYSH
jgi:hypothetical protein